MPLYAVIGIDHPPHSMALRDRVRSEHRQYYLEKSDQMARLAGAMYDDDGNQCGSLLIFEADSAEQIREWFAGEPFFKNGVYRDFLIIEWRQALNRLEPSEWTD